MLISIWLPQWKHYTTLCGIDQQCEQTPPLSPVEEGVSKRVEFAERLVGVYDKGVPGDDALHLPVHDRSEAVGGGFRSHPAPWDILLQKIPVNHTCNLSLSVLENERTQHLKVFDAEP